MQYAVEKDTNKDLDEGLLDAYSRAVIEAAEKVSPSVVYIQVTGVPGGRQRRGQGPKEVTGTGSGFVFAPDLGFLWAACVGIFTGAVLPLNLVLPVDVADRPGEIGAAAAMMLLGGYLVAFSGPAFLGLIRDLTGSFDGVLWALVGIGLASAGVSALLSPARLRRGLRSEPLAVTPSA